MDNLTALRDALGAGNAPRARTQRQLARALGGAMLGALSRSQAVFTDLVALGDERLPLYRFGEAMMDAMWPAEGEADPAAMAQIETEIAGITDPVARRACCDMLARLGHMHQMAGLMLRDLELEEATTPTTAQSFLSGDFDKRRGLPYNPKTDAGKAVAALNTPRLEMTFTGHPTNTNALSSMIAQREIARTLHAWRKNAATDHEVEAAFDQYANAPLLPERKDAPPGLSVRDEVQTMLYFLNNAYSDLDTIYAGYDRALGERFKDRYEPAALRLGIRYHSWGSSADKDGNANVNADTTLYAVAQHHQQILTRYREALADMPGLEDWKDRIAHAQTIATQVSRALEAALDRKGHVPEGMFDHLAKDLKQAVAALDQDAFIAALEQQPPTPELISLIRHVHGFGFNFGTLEYRETAEEFTRIVGALIPDYPADEAGRRAALDAILADPEKLQKFSQDFRALASGVEGKPYSGSDVAPIAYHTRKRLELARDFPHAIDNHVLAECQDASNLLELLLLQKAVGNGQQPGACMGIVPLFEDSGPLANAPEILKAALADPHYRAHLDTVAALQHAKPAQQMQLAHSDNARRNGLPAARALIYRAHQELRQAMDEVNAQSSSPVELQFYEGGSLSDPYRGGVRAVSAAINEYGLHDFAKMTVQGGDLLNYFNLPDSIYRLMMRNVTHNAAKLNRGPQGIDREEPVIAALADTKDEYKQLFTSSDINDFCERIGFAAETKAGNTSSRAGKRPNGGGGSDRVDVTKVRTISFSEGFQHAGLCPTWIGSLTLLDQLHAQGIESESPRALKRYYDASPVFKDTIDRMLFGLVRTDMPYLRERSGNHPLMQRFEEEYARAFKLCLEAYTGKPLRDFTEHALTPAEQHDLLIREVYPHVTDVFADQDRFTALARRMKKDWLGTADDPDSKSMVLHNAIDTVLHGRMPLIDDPTYATLYCRDRGIVRPHVHSGSGAHLAA